MPQSVDKLHKREKTEFPSVNHIIMNILIMEMEVAPSSMEVRAVQPSESFVNDASHTISSGHLRQEYFLQKDKRFLGRNFV